MMTMLFVVFAFSFAAMTLIATICQAATKEFGLDDFQTPLICITVFPIAFAVFSVPMAWLAERFNRRWLITLCLLVWGGAAIGAGFAQMEGVAVLREVLARWDVAAVGPEEPKVRNITSVPKRGALVRVTRR